MENHIVKHNNRRFQKGKDFAIILLKIAKELDILYSALCGEDIEENLEIQE